MNAKNRNTELALITNHGHRMLLSEIVGACYIH